MKWSALHQLLILFLSSLIATTACTKKKAPQFPDGVGQDLLVISEYDGKTGVLQTLQPKSNVFYSSSEYASDKEKIKLVNYETAAPLVPKDVMLSGLPSESYKLIYKVTEQKLIIFRNANLKYFANEERVISEKESDGTLSLPFVSYDITGFYRIEVAKNENGDKTTKLREQAVASKAQATHFKISRIPSIEGIKDNKQFIFKSNYFDGIWYASSVIASTAEEDSDMLGYQVSIDSKWDSADKIEFLRTEDHIVGLNARVDKRLKMDDDSAKLNNLSTVISFPADYFDYGKPSSTDSFKYSGDNWNRSRHWKEREWAFINIKKLSTTLVKLMSGEPTISNLKITDDFFMYSLQFSGMKVTMSFLRESALKKVSGDYNSKNFFSDDFRYYGFFATKKKALNTFDQYRKENFEVYRFINRFQPENYSSTSGEKRRRIRFFMTEDSVTDPAFIATAREALKAWDFAFKQVGLNDVDVYLDESERVSLGDIRYNTINMVKTLTSTSLLGYGPSIADPDTGQIISATTNIHLTSIRDYLISNLRNYLRYRRNELTDKYPFGVKIKSTSSNTAGSMWPMIAAPSAELETPSTSSTAEDDISAVSPGLTGSKTKQIRNKVFRKSVDSFLYGKARCDFESSSGNLIRDIESTAECAELKQIGGKALQDVATMSCSDSKSGARDCAEIDALTKCADALLPAKIKATMIHELGHNLGLRHNFRASVDPTNYAKKFDEKQLAGMKNYSCPMGKENLPVLARSNSVMEYTDFNEDRLIFVGPYDVEAIRFGYADHVMDSNCQVHPLNIKKTIDQNLNGNTVIPLKFCTDEHIELGLDPLCQRHDSGENAFEIVNNTINQYNAMYALNNYRHDRAKSPSPKRLKEIKESLIFDRFKRLYEQWRIYLTAFVGEENAMLDRYYDSSTYQIGVLDKMRTSVNSQGQPSEHAIHYKDYFDATREIFKFLTKVLFMPDRYCLVKKVSKDGVEQSDIIELTSLIKTVENKTGKREISCHDKYIQEELKQHGEFIREVGFYFENQKASGDMHSNLQDMMNSITGSTFYQNLEHKRDELDSYWDVVGSRLDKELAIDVLARREPFLFFAKQKGFTGTFLDEPTLREEFIKKFLKRLVKGVAYTDVYPEKANDESYQNAYFEKWNSEYQHLFKTWENIRSFIGDREASTEARSRLWEHATTQDKQKSDSLPEEQKLELKDGSYFIAPRAENTFTIECIARIKYLLKMQKDEPTRYQKQQIEYDAQLMLIKRVLAITGL